MKRIPLQLKLIIIIIIALSIPILFINTVYLKYKHIETTKKIISNINEKFNKIASDINTLEAEANNEADEDFKVMYREKLAKMDPESQEFLEYISNSSKGDSEEEEESENGEDNSEETEGNTDNDNEDETEEETEDEESDDNVKKKTTTDKVEIAETKDEDSENSEEDNSEEKPKEIKTKLTREELQQLKEEKLAQIDSLIELTEKHIIDFKHFLGSKSDGASNLSRLNTLDKSLDNLIHNLMLFYYFSWWILIFSVVAIYLFILHESRPFNKITENLKSFQNEKESAPTDLVECALKFDNFLTTAKTLLQESYSISQEIGKKLEPLTVVSVFSDDNVKQFFTDVQEISRSSNYIANTLDSTTAHIQEVSASAQTIADRSHEAATDSAETAAIAGEGKNAVSETIDTMESIKDEVLGLEDVIENLNSASKQIGEIVNTITNIAYQTNLLALNAAIEAARAGEHGQGFTVVANEVKKLAEESGEAADDISKKIKEMLKKTGLAVETINRGASKVIEGVNIANLAGNNLDKIVNSVSNVNKMIQDISNASTEQSQNIDSLRGSIESITGATRITSEGTKRVASAVNEQLANIRQYISVTKELLTLVQMMSDMLDKFDYD